MRLSIPLPPPPKGLERLTLEQAIEIFLKYLEASGASNRTLKVYKAALKRFAEFAGPNRPMYSVGDSDYLAWSASLSRMASKGGLSQATSHYYTVLVRKFLKWAGSLTEAPALPKGPRRVRGALSWGEVEALISAARDLYDALIVALMAETGMRVGELLSLEYKDVDLERGVARVRGKYGKERLVALGPISRALIVEAGVRSGWKGRVIPLSYKAVYKRIKKLAERAGVDPRRVSPHILRHTFATEALRRGISLASLQKLLGHSDIKVTQVYLHLTTEDALREYEKAFLAHRAETAIIAAPTATPTPPHQLNASVQVAGFYHPEPPPAINAQQHQYQLQPSQPASVGPRPHALLYPNRRHPFQP